MGFGWKRAVLSLTLLVGLTSWGCGPKYPACDDDSNCKDKGEFCVDNMCRECRDDAFCANKAGDDCQACSASYTCDRAPGCCHSDVDCPGGKCWIDAGAKTGSCGGECRGNEHCPAGRVCQGGRCVVPGGDCAQTGCPSGQKCVNGACEWICNLQNVYFDFNESNLTSDARRLLGQNVECAKTIGVPLSVEGHCDERGTDEYNMQLGMRRATSVKRFMSDKGVTGGNLSTISYGEDHPVCSDAGENCWWRNRRAETKVK
jgi:peptidoglycan-associated lipoprotein